MKQPITQKHWNDSDGNPAGGATFGAGFAISWQNGPLGRGDQRREPNGAFVECVIAAALGRLEWYQSGRFACQSNAVALERLQQALAALESRTQSREERQVEGTHAV